jgi:hypothetical protein
MRADEARRARHERRRLGRSSPLATMTACDGAPGESLLELVVGHGS